MAKPTIAVFGGTGRQGGGVIDALLASGQFSVRAASRNPGSDAAKALARRGVDVAKADLLNAASLRPLLEGAYGAFVVTNFWDPAQMHGMKGGTRSHVTLAHGKDDQNGAETSTNHAIT